MGSDPVQWEGKGRQAVRSIGQGSKNSESDGMGRTVEDGKAGEEAEGSGGAR